MMPLEDLGVAVVLAAAVLAGLGMVVDRAGPRGGHVFAWSALGLTTLGAVLSLRQVVVTQDSDLFIYSVQFERSRYVGVLESMAQADRDAAFAGVMSLAARAGASFEQFWAGLVVVLVLSIAAAIRAAAGLPRAALVTAFLPFWFPFVNFSTNTLRQGLAASLVVLAMSGRGVGRTRLVLLWGACLVHWSALVPAILVTLHLWLRPSRQALWMMLLGGAALFVTGANATLLRPLAGANDLSGSYTSEESFVLYGDAGNRLDFFVFTCALVAIAAVLEHLARRENPALDGFLVLCLAYFLFGFVAFSDRIASFAWVYWVVVLGVAVRSRALVAVPRTPAPGRASVARVRHAA